MDKQIDINSVYIISDNVVIREIEGEAIIVPIAAGVGNLEDELYTVNESGKKILSMLDGKRNINEIARALSVEFNEDEKDILADVTGFMNELYGRKILVSAS